MEEYKEIGLNDLIKIKLTKAGAREINRYNATINYLVGNDNFKKYDYKEGDVAEMQVSEVFETFQKCNFNCGGEILFKLLVKI